MTEPTKELKKIKVSEMVTGGLYVNIDDDVMPIYVDADPANNEKIGDLQPQEWFMFLGIQALEEETGGDFPRPNNRYITVMSKEKTGVLIADTDDIFGIKEKE